jgi:HSP20 family protein
MAQENAATEKNNERSPGTALAPARLFAVPAEMFRWTPFTSVGRIMEEMERMIGMRAGVKGSAMPLWSPAIEISQHNGDYEIRAELAGLKPEDVKVEVNGDALVLEGDRRFEYEENKDGIYRTERQYGHFYRSIPLPEGANVDQAQARFDNGVLTITVPVSEMPPSHRQIPVETTSSAGAQDAQK